MIGPKRQKHKKQFRGRMRGQASRATALAFGEWGLKALGRGWLSSRQIEAGRRALAHSTARGGKIWTRVFPDKPVSQKSAGVRMGGGKGDIAEYVAVVRPGGIIFELSGIDPAAAEAALRLAAAKLPLATKITRREKT